MSVSNINSGIHAGGHASVMKIKESREKKMTGA